jgi:hypothetical protein
LLNAAAAVEGSFEEVDDEVCKYASPGTADRQTDGGTLTHTHTHPHPHTHPS